MLQILLILALCFLLIVISLCVGGSLLSAGFYSKDRDFMEFMNKFNSWKHSTFSYSTDNEKSLLLENDNTNKKDE